MSTKLAISSLALAAAFLIGGEGGGYAADVLSRGGMKDTVDAAPSSPVVNWNGVYFGVQGGWMNANHDISADESCTTCSESDGPDSINFLHLNGLNSSGFIGGGVIGADRRFGDWVAGVQAYYHVSNADTKLSVDGGFLTGSIEKDDEYGGVVRFGRLVSSNVLLYGLAGYNWAKYSLHATEDGKAVDFTDTGVKTSNTFGGVIAGAGVEYALTSNIFVGAEYTHFFGGKENWFRHDGECETCTVAVTDDLSEDRVMATLKVKLNGGLFGGN